MDYNRLQLLYRKEIALLSKWWINIGHIEKVPYVRDRIVESYIWSLGTIFEPKYSLPRMMIGKYAQLATIIDDTYDSYGTIDELELFTEALQKFTIDAGEGLPEYLKFIYRILFEDLETGGTRGCDNIPEPCSYKTSFLKEMIKELARAYLVEAHWQKEKIAPSFDDYVQNGKVTSTFDYLASSCIVGMENIGLKEILWLQTNPEIVIGAKITARFMNDIAVRKDETNRGDFLKVLDCYPEQYGVL